MAKLRRHTNRTGRVKKDLRKLKSILRTTARDVQGQAKIALSDSYSNLVDRAMGVQEKVARKVIRNPLGAISLAAGIGVVASKLFLGKKRRVKYRL